MFSYCILLAFCSTLDSLGLGIAYGLKNIRFQFIAKIILFACSFFITFISLVLGNILINIIPKNIINFIGSFILIIIGLFLIFSCFRKENNFDFDNSKYIDYKEALFLGFALSVDSFGIGVSSSIFCINIFFLPFLVSIFHLFFLSFGNYIGKKIKKTAKIPDCIWNFIAGFLLIIIGILKFSTNNY